MKKLIIACTTIAAMIATPALAADMALKTAPYSPPPAASSWSGCYVGANGGAGRGTDTWSFEGQLLTDVHPQGFFGGGQIGCDYQAGAFVFGVEGSYHFSDLHGQALVPPAVSVGLQLNSRINSFATGTGRVGYAFDRVLLYGKGGFAWARFREELACICRRNLSACGGR